MWILAWSCGLTMVVTLSTKTGAAFFGRGAGQDRWNPLLENYPEERQQLRWSGLSALLYLQESLRTLLPRLTFIASRQQIDSFSLLALQTRNQPSREKQGKSVEEREEEYQRTRDRIFNQEVRQGDRGRWGETRQRQRGDLLISLLLCYSLSTPRRAPM